MWLVPASPVARPMLVVRPTRRRIESSRVVGVDVGWVPVETVSLVTQPKGKLAMFIEVTCACGKLFRAKPEHAGRTGRCSICGRTLQIPSAPGGVESDFGPITPSLAPSVAHDVPVVGFTPPPPAPATVPYIYKMKQIPQNISIQEGDSMTDKVALYLEKIVNEYAEKGWEFFRVDEMGYRINPGCLGALFGQQPERVSFYVVTFRRDARSTV